jgi:hypothetical protein
VPAYFTGTYELLTPQTGNLVAVQYGNPGPFEMDIVFSPAYNSHSPPSDIADP